MVNLARVKRGMYFDSITLMGVARALGGMEGIEEVAAVMATPANLQLLVEAGLAPFEGVTDGAPGETDVLLVVRADDLAHAQAALDAAEARLLADTRESIPAAGGAGRVRQPCSLE